MHAILPSCCVLSHGHFLFLSRLASAVAAAVAAAAAAATDVLLTSMIWMRYPLPLFLLASSSISSTVGFWYWAMGRVRSTNGGHSLGMVEMVILSRSRSWVVVEELLWCTSQVARG